MGDDQHLSIGQASTQHILDCSIRGVVEVGCAFIHDEKAGIAELEETPSKSKKLPLSLTCWTSLVMYHLNCKIHLLKFFPPTATFSSKLLMTTRSPSSSPSSAFFRLFFRTLLTREALGSLVVEVLKVVRSVLD